MWYQIFSYIKFLGRSTTKHGVHSPFVYQLVNQGFNTQTPKNIVTQLQAYNRQLFENSTVIEVTDFGAGSRVFSSNKRKISALARHSGTPLRKQKLLYRITSHLQCVNLLELGTSLGRGTMALALNPHSRVTTVEGCPHTAAIAQQYFTRYKMHNIQLEVGQFEKVLPNFQTSWDAVYVDGGHSLEQTLSYVNLLFSQVHNDSVIILDDIYLNPQMTQAWHQLQKHPKVSVSIDIFDFGLLFFRKEQRPQRFTIRV